MVRHKNSEMNRIVGVKFFFKNKIKDSPDLQQLILNILYKHKAIGNTEKVM